MSMASREGILYAVLRALGQDRPYADGVDLARRIEIQKLVYLAQESLRRHNMTLNYSFNWYLRGPYSPSLARDCYGLDKTDAVEPESVNLTPEAAEALAPVRGLCDKKPAELAVSEWLELLASLQYYATRSRVRVSVHSRLSVEAMTEFRQYKPQFEEEHIQLAWSTLAEASLVG